MANRRSGKLRRWLLALFTIPKCAACGKRLDGREHFLCGDCNLRFLTERAKHCTACGFPHALCRCGIQAAGDIYRVFHIAPYDPKNYGVVSRVVFVAKDKYVKDTFAFMAEQCGKALEANEIEPENDWLVAWVPRRKRTIRRIGHDQSKTIAKIIAKNYGLKTVRLFVNKGNQPQKIQNFGGRVRNAFSSYAVTRSGRNKVYGKTVIIVDDLVTTGATQHVAISLAMDAGAHEVIPVAFAKTDRGYKKYKGKK